MLSVSVLIIAAYMAVRALIYRSHPAYTMEEWMARDILMTLPRLAGFGATLWAMRSDQLPGSSPSPLDRAIAALGLALVVAVWWFWELVPQGRADRPFPDLFIALWTSLVVGLFEEYMFRGHLLAALPRRWPPLASSGVSAAIFTVYHVQAQPIEAWPMIFLFGVVFGNLRWMGTGLMTLSLAHGLIDWSVFFFSGEAAATQPRALLGLLILVGLSSAWVAQRNTRAASPHPLE